MKKLFICTTALLMAIGIIHTTTVANEGIKVVIEGEQVVFHDQPPVIVDGRTLVPVRGVFETINFDVEWNGETDQVTLTDASHEVLISIDSDTFTTNNISYQLDVPAQIIGGRTMLPIRAVLESVGYELDWDEKTSTVLITSKPIPIDTAAVEEKLFELINQERMQNGLTPFILNTDLQSLTYEHVLDMAANDLTGSISSDGLNISQRLGKTQLEFGTVSGHSARFNSSDANEIFQQMLNNSTWAHRINSEHATNIGLSVYNAGKNQLAVSFVHGNPTSSDNLVLAKMVFDLINEERISQGLPVLEWSESLANNKSITPTLRFNINSNFDPQAILRSTMTYNTAENKGQVLDPKMTHVGISIFPHTVGDWSGLQVVQIYKDEEQEMNTVYTIIRAFHCPVYDRWQVDFVDNDGNYYFLVPSSSGNGWSMVSQGANNRIIATITGKKLSTTDEYFRVVDGQIEVVSASPSSNANNANAEAEASEFERKVLELVNIERTNRGLGALIWHDGLADVARTHSEDMGRSGNMSHTGSDGSSPSDRFNRSGITDVQYSGENVAYGYRTPEDVVNGWMDSPGHRANILNSNSTHLGVGFYRTYWTQMFAR